MALDAIADPRTQPDEGLEAGDAAAGDDDADAVADVTHRSSLDPRRRRAIRADAAVPIRSLPPP